MPEISRFLGMVIQMYFDDHSEPHIHIRYAENRAKVDLNGNLLNGFLPLPKLHILKRWINLHNDELLENWNKLRNAIKPERIKPWE